MADVQIDEIFTTIEGAQVISDTEDTQLVVESQQQTQIVLAVPGVQGAIGSNFPPSGTTDQLLFKQSNTSYDTGWKFIVNANVDGAAAIAGTKISPDFGSQTVRTTGVFSHALATAGAPSITFSGDTNTGLFSPGADQVAISTGGTGRLFVDATGRVGIGTTSANAYGMRLAVIENIGLIPTTQDTITTSAVAIKTQLGSSGGEELIRSEITSFTNGGNYGTATIFNTRGGASVSERLRITSDGKVGIGTSSPVGTLDVNVGGGGPSRIVFGQASDNPWIDLYRGNGIGGFSGFRLSNGSAVTGELVFSAATGGVIGAFTYTERARIDSSGRLLVGTGTALSGGFNDNGTNSQSSNPRLQVAGTDWSQASATFATYQNAAGVFSQISFNKSRGATVGTIGAALLSGDAIGGFQFAGSDSAKFLSCAAIEAYADGGFAVNSAPGRIVFKTNPGTANLTERMRLDSSGRLLVGTSSALLLGNSLSNFAINSETLIGAGVLNHNIGATRHGGPTPEAGPVICLARSRGTTLGAVTLVANGDTLGVLEFSGADGTDFGTTAASIKCEVDGTPGANDMPGRLVFSTTADGAATPTERMRIASGGNIGIGETNPLSTLSIRKDTVGGRGAELSIVNYATTTQGNEAALNFGLENSTYDGNNGNAQIKAVLPNVGGAATDLVFSNYNGSAFGEAMRIHNQRELLIGTTTRTANGGVLQVSNGITFPGTQSACSDPNTLDDYEEGTFTPTLVGQTTPGTGTYTNQTGRYTKIGNRVFIHVYLSWTAHTGTGNMRVTGLPFTSVSGTNFDTVLASLVSDLTLSANAVLQVYVVNGSSDIIFNQVVPNGGTTGSVTMDTSGLVVFSGHYFV